MLCGAYGCGLSAFEGLTKDELDALAEIFSALVLELDIDACLSAFVSVELKATVHLQIVLFHVRKDVVSVSSDLCVDAQFVLSRCETLGVDGLLCGQWVAFGFGGLEDFLFVEPVRDLIHFEGTTKFTHVNEGDLGLFEHLELALEDLFTDDIDLFA